MMAHSLQTGGGPDMGFAERALMRVAHVLGIAHSGTTIMDRILSSYPGVIGLGEAQKMWVKMQRGTLREAHPCPCGETHLTCPFWGKVLDRDYDTSDGFFRRLVEVGQAEGHALMVDTSKALLSSEAYSRLRKEGLIDEFLQIRLIRDPRGWVHSMVRREEIDPNDVNAIRALFYRWLFSYVKLDRKTARSGNTLVYVWYDKLALEESQNKLAELIGLPLPPGGQISLKDANQHAIAGNKFVHAPGRERLRYDGGWLANRLLEDLYADMPGVRAYYHEAQKLHLTKDGRMRHERSVAVEPDMINESALSGEFSALEEQARMLESVAQLPGTFREAA
jgi:hypothetical protein